MYDRGQNVVLSHTHSHNLYLPLAIITGGLFFIGAALCDVREVICATTTIIIDVVFTSARLHCTDVVFTSHVCILLCNHHAHQQEGVGCLCRCCRGKDPKHQGQREGKAQGHCPPTRVSSKPVLHHARRVSLDCCIRCCVTRPLHPLSCCRYFYWRDSVLTGDALSTTAHQCACVLAAASLDMPLNRAQGEGVVGALLQVQHTARPPLRRPCR
jgi:hypothetical protein